MFHKDSSKKDGISTPCKNCKRNKYRENIEQARKKQREYKKVKHREDPRKLLVQLAKQRAIRVGVPFNIKYTDLTIPKVCPILGIPMSVGDINVKYGSPSLDRIVPSLGYTKDNTQVISHLANTMKSSASSELLIKFAEWILHRFKEDGPLKSSDIINTPYT